MSDILRVSRICLPCVVWFTYAHEPLLNFSLILFGVLPMPSPNFERAIHDLDHAAQDPRAMQDARNAILSEIRDVTARHPEINPQQTAQAIVHKINEVENMYPHQHHDVQLVQNQQGFLDVAPIPGYGAQPGYGQQGEFQPPAPPPYNGGYEPGYAGPPPVVYEQGNPAGAIVGGVIAGAVIGSILSGGRRHR